MEALDIDVLKEIEKANSDPERSPQRRRHGECSTAGSNSPTWDSGDVVMKVLVAFGTAHGSTQTIAQAIGDRLAARGLDVVVGRVDDLRSMVATSATPENPHPFDAAVIGSAVHSGRWLPEATAFVHDAAPALANHPVWLFSVCSLGETTSFLGDRISRYARSQRRDSKELAGLRQRTTCHDHRYFAGVVKKGQWNRFGDLFLLLTGGHHGDQRDWADIDRWANHIADQLVRAEP